VGRSTTVLRLTAAGVLVILMALTALSLVGVAKTRHSSATATKARALADAYTDACATSSRSRRCRRSCSDWR
jgi:hypothetical protein